MKIGIIARADNSGLGNLSVEYFNHLNCDRALLVRRSYRMFPERFSNYVESDGDNPSDEQIKEFLNGLDVLLTIETPYNQNTFQIARKLGVKTVLIPMYEFIGNYSPDLFMCGSQIDYDYSPSNKVFIPIAIDRNKLKFNQKKIAHTFLHNAGHGGIMGRNGTKELIDAMKHVKSDIKLVINSQYPIDKVNDSRIEFNFANFKNYWDMFSVGDMFIMPVKFGGNFLAFNEALSCGMPIITTDYNPHNTFLPNELLIKPDKIIQTKVIGGKRFIDFHILKPEDIAKKIDEFANKDISELSNKMNVIAEEISWDNIKPKIIKEFTKLCEGKQI